MYGNLTSLENFIEEYQQIEATERNLLAEIASLFEQEAGLKSEMQLIHKRLPNISVFSGDADLLAGRVDFTSTLASNVSSKVKQLDFTKNKVANALKFTNDILDLKYCAENIEKALKNHEYEVAAVNIQRCLSIDESVIKTGTTPIKGKLLSETSLSDAFRNLHDAADKLRAIVMRKFDDAVRDGDVAGVERFFKILSKLNQRDDGIRKFSNYLCNRMSDFFIKSMAGSQEPPSHLDQITWLFDATAKTMPLFEPIFEPAAYYGPEYLISVFETFQRECDRHAKQIIEDFKVKKGLTSICNLIQKPQKSGSSNSLNKLDPREIDSLLTEMTLLNSRSETYLKFLHNRVTNDILQLAPEESKQRLECFDRLDKLVRNCQLNLMIQELNGSYVLLEEFFLKESCTKAIALDDIDSSNSESLTSSMLDDVFFIVKKCITRALSGGSVDVLCAIINHSVGILDTSLCEALNERIKYGYPKTGISGAAVALDLSQAYNAIQAGRYLQTNSDIEKAKTLFLVALNNFDVACDCLKSLKTIIQEQVSKSSHLSQYQVQRDKLESCLNDLLSLTNKYRTLLNSGINQLYTGLLKPRLKSWIDAFQSESYQLTESDILRCESNDGLRQFTQTFMINLDSTFKSSKTLLTANNYRGLVSSFSTDFAQRLEKAILKCSFNKLGVYQFDREMRAIINYICAQTSVSIRGTFSRLKNIAIILNFDSVDEIDDFFQNHQSKDQIGAQWWLTPNEIRQILRLRSDFSILDIAKIRL